MSSKAADVRGAGDKEGSEGGASIHDRSGPPRFTFDFPRAGSQLEFNGRNCSEFLRHFEIVYDQQGSSSLDKCQCIQLYIRKAYAKSVADLPGIKARNWTQAKAEFIVMFGDSEKRQRSLRDLDRFVKQSVRKHGKIHSIRGIAASKPSLRR